MTAYVEEVATSLVSCGLLTRTAGMASTDKYSVNATVGSSASPAEPLPLADIVSMPGFSLLRSSAMKSMKESGGEVIEQQYFDEQ